jgi:hypothetical protein
LLGPGNPLGHSKVLGKFEKARKLQAGPEQESSEKKNMYVFRFNIYTHALIYNLAMVWYLYSPLCTGSNKKRKQQ